MKVRGGRALNAIYRNRLGVTPKKQKEFTEHCLPYVSDLRKFERQVLHKMQLYIERRSEIKAGVSTTPAQNRDLSKKLADQCRELVEALDGVNSTDAIGYGLIVWCLDEIEQPGPWFSESVARVNQLAKGLDQLSAMFASGIGPGRNTSLLTKLSEELAWVYWLNTNRTAPTTTMPGTTHQKLLFSSVLRWAMDCLGESRKDEALRDYVKIGVAAVKRASE